MVNEETENCESESEQEPITVDLDALPPELRERWEIAGRTNAGRMDRARMMRAESIDAGRRKAFSLQFKIAAGILFAAGFNSLMNRNGSFFWVLLLCTIWLGFAWRHAYANPEVLKEKQRKFSEDQP